MSQPTGWQHPASKDGPSLNRRLATSSAVLSAAILGVSASNYALNLVLARALTPSAFGDAALIVTIMLILSAIGVTLQLCTARQIVVAPNDRAAIRHQFVAWALKAGRWIGAGLILTAPVLGFIFKTDSILPFIILGIGVPSYLRQSVDRGILQGEYRFGGLAATFIVEGVVRLVVGVSLIAVGVGSLAAALALSASFIATARLASSQVGPISDLDTDRDDAQTNESASGTPLPAAPIALAATILLIGQVLINNGDVLLAKFAFDPDQAGLYAGIALIGRAIFFASWAIANAAFPLLADPSLSRRSRLRISSAATGAVAGFGLLSAALLIPLGPLVCRVALGSTYDGSVSLLAPYALATALFAIANMAATLDVAQGKSLSAMLVLCAAIWQTAILGLFGSTPQSMIWLQIMVMGFLTILLGSFHVLRGLAPEPATQLHREARAETNQP